ncbi:uncharacterized protein LOC110101395 [Dendrobium catenatum]|uniref:uncharacterized protein LOC110101395 n=1 Tax=Dendrobium catenatum TaxID=906689 RepID=UPI00109F2789|nr:uncharacterized protein LOC110101395 [Dendrobium catenatum]
MEAGNENIQVTEEEANLKIINKKVNALNKRNERELKSVQGENVVEIQDIMIMENPEIFSGKNSVSMDGITLPDHKITMEGCLRTLVIQEELPANSGIPISYDNSMKKVEALTEQRDLDGNVNVESPSKNLLLSGNKFNLLNSIGDKNIDVEVIAESIEEELEEEVLVNTGDCKILKKETRDKYEAVKGSDNLVENLSSQKAEKNSSQKAKLSKELRGANKREASLYLKEYIKKWDVFFVGIIETKIDYLSKDDFVKIMGDDWNFFLHPSRGNSGGIMVIWNTKVASFSVTISSDQCVMGELDIFNKSKWMVATIYGSREFQGRRELWRSMDGMVEKDTPTVIEGDFNCILSQEEKKGGKKFSFSDGPMEMKAFMNNNDLHDVGTIGAKFTWCNNKKGSARILEKLDICLLNSKALELIFIPSVRHLEGIASVHCPIVLKLFNQHVQKPRFRKFEDIWLSYAASTAVVKKYWDKPVKGDDMEAVNKKMARQEEASEDLFSDSKALLLISKVREFNCTRARLSTLWKQRAKAKWMKEGDVNSSFFHAFANGRRNNNSIKQMLNEEGELTEDPASIRSIFYQFFCNKWEYRNSDLNNWPLNKNVLKTEDCKMLESVFTLEEVEKVIKEFGNNIAPGLDGITYSFLKAYWKIIGMDIWKAMQLYFTSGKMSTRWKETLVILIPNVSNLRSPSNFKPISLCMSIYKIDAKVLLNRLKKVIHNLVSEEQVAFIEGRALSEHNGLSALDNENCWVNYDGLIATQSIQILESIQISKDVFNMAQNLEGKEDAAFTSSDSIVVSDKTFIDIGSFIEDIPIVEPEAVTPIANAKKNDGIEESLNKFGGLCGLVSAIIQKIVTPSSEDGSLFEIPDDGDSAQKLFQISCYEPHPWHLEVGYIYFSK